MSLLATPLRRTLAAVTAVLAGGASAVAVASPAAAIVGRVVVGVSSPLSTDVFKQVNSICPAGTVALGGGAGIIGGDFSAHVTATAPMAVSQGHVARAEVHAGGAAPWQVRSYSVCGSGVTGRSFVYEDSTIGAGLSTGSVSVACPVGKQVIGMGGYVSADDFILSSVDVNSTLTSVTMWWARGLDVAGTLTGLAEASAVCVDPVPGLERVRVFSANDSLDKVLLPTCPSGKLVYDVGGGVSGSLGQRIAKIDVFVPLTTNAGVTVREIPPGSPSNWKAFGTVICA